MATMLKQHSSEEDVVVNETNTNDVDNVISKECQVPVFPGTSIDSDLLAMANSPALSEMEPQVEPISLDRNSEFMTTLNEVLEIIRHRMHISCLCSKHELAIQECCSCKSVQISDLISTSSSKRSDKETSLVSNFLDSLTWFKDAPYLRVSMASFLFLGKLIDEETVSKITSSIERFGEEVNSARLFSKQTTEKAIYATGFSCLFCDFSTSSRTDFIKHTKSNHGLTLRQKKKPASFRCDKCPNLDFFNSRSALSAHTLRMHTTSTRGSTRRKPGKPKKHKTEVEVLVETSGFENDVREALREDVSSVPSNNEADSDIGSTAGDVPIRSAAPVPISKRTRSRKQGIPSEPRQARAWKCTRCAESLMKRDIKNHLQHVHNSQFQLFPCVRCDSIFEQDLELELHKIKAHDDPSSCSLCLISIDPPTAEECENHILEAHSTPPHLCPYEHCDHTFDTITALLTHMRSQHSKEGVTLCTTCGKQFKTKESCRNHEKRAHSKTSVSATCHTCEKVLSSRDALAEHLRTVHNDRRDYLCFFCGYAAKSDRVLRAHIRRTHEASETFRCTYCSFIGKRRESIRLHMRRHTRDKPYVCRHCSFRASSHRIISRHMYIHSNIYPYKCDWCPYGARQPQQLKSHVQLHHPEHAAMFKPVLNKDLVVQSRAGGPMYTYMPTDRIREKNINADDGAEDTEEKISDNQTEQNQAPPASAPAAENHRSETTPSQTSVPVPHSVSATAYHNATTRHTTAFESTISQRQQQQHHQQTKQQSQHPQLLGAVPQTGFSTAHRLLLPNSSVVPAPNATVSKPAGSVPDINVNHLNQLLSIPLSPPHGAPILNQPPGHPSYYTAIARQERPRPAHACGLAAQTQDTNPSVAAPVNPVRRKRQSKGKSTSKRAKFSSPTVAQHLTTTTANAQRFQEIQPHIELSLPSANNQAAHTVTQSSSSLASSVMAAAAAAAGLPTVVSQLPAQSGHVMAHQSGSQSNNNALANSAAAVPSQPAPTLMLLNAPTAETIVAPIVVGSHGEVIARIQPGPTVAPVAANQLLARDQQLSRDQLLSRVAHDISLLQQQTAPTVIAAGGHLQPAISASVPHYNIQPIQAVSNTQLQPGNAPSIAPPSIIQMASAVSAAGSSHSPSVSGFESTVSQPNNPGTAGWNLTHLPLLPQLLAVGGQPLLMSPPSGATAALSGDNLSSASASSQPNHQHHQFVIDSSNQGTTGGPSHQQPLSLISNTTPLNFSQRTAVAVSETNHTTRITEPAQQSGSATPSRVPNVTSNTNSVYIAGWALASAPGNNN